MHKLREMTRLGTSMLGQSVDCFNRGEAGLAMVVRDRDAQLKGIKALDQLARDKRAVVSAGGAAAIVEAMHLCMRACIRALTFAHRALV